MSKKLIHVVVGLIFNNKNQILIAQRQAQKFQGGRFEFPGGKVEPEEDPLKALIRELHEEIGIEVITAEPWNQFHHEYSDRKIFLDVWKILQFKGEAHGKEGQQVQWVFLSELKSLNIPDANHDIIKLL